VIGCYFPSPSELEGRLTAGRLRGRILELKDIEVKAP
jgi:hypothetical protein